MTTLSEVAQAIHDDCGGWFAPSFNVSASDLTDTAREALLAIRIPSVAMLDAMKDNIGPLSYMWTAAIDAILEQTE